MEKVRPWCGQPSDRGRLRNRTEQNSKQPVPELKTGYYIVMQFCITTKDEKQTMDILPETKVTLQLLLLVVHFIMAGSAGYYIGDYYVLCLYFFCLFLKLLYTGPCYAFRTQCLFAEQHRKPVGCLSICNFGTQKICAFIYLN